MDRSLPIFEALPALKEHLHTARTVLLQAPPGAGKSTVLPLQLLGETWLRGQKILMLEPRRLAARTVAARMACLIDEPLGQTVGYRVRFENQISARTRIEVLTEGILTRRLQSDPALADIGLVIFDEFHERSLHADLALALCREVQDALRSDLRVLIMSATLDGAALQDALGSSKGAVPVVTANGRQHPVEIIHSPRDAELQTALAHTVSAAVGRALAEQVGDVLVFLPGTAEIQRTQALLEPHQKENNVLLCPLYGELPLDAQQVAIVPDPRGRRKVVLATAIAETSLTIEGVRVVVDSGFARVPRFDSRSGLTRLDTVRVSRDSADQRAGRAGRLGPGVCYRLWTLATHARLNAARKPEILEADLAPLRLELAQWGAQPSAVQWISPPPVGALNQAQILLQQLHALHNDELTFQGKSILAWPTHPRLAHMLIESQRQRPLSALAALAADIAALLDERDPLPREASADLTLRVEALRHWRTHNASLHNADLRVLARVERIAAQWRKRLGARTDNAPVYAEAVGELLMLAYPDRIAQQREARSGRYRLANGRGVRLADGDALVGTPWLVAAHVDAGGAEGRVFLAAPIDEAKLEPLAQVREVLGWDSAAGALVARREQRIGELVLASKPLAQAPSTEQRIQLLLDVVRAEGLTLLNWTDAARSWQARAQCLHLWRGADWPDVSDASLLARCQEWLAPWLSEVTKRADFARLDVLAMLETVLTHQQQRQLEVLAPTHLAVPSGSRIRLAYALDGAAPGLAVKLQEVFGLADTPTVNEGRTKVMLHLLSPAQRPVQVTQDLRSFWTNTYPAVRKELRGRYNKHPWPADPWHAPPTRKTVKAATKL